MKAIVCRGLIAGILLIGSGGAFASENASNPLAKVKNTDLRWKHVDLDPATLDDLSIDGAFMAMDSLKVKYELHYWDTDVSGNSQSHLESALLKGIFFPSEGRRGTTGFRTAVGLDWIIDLGDQDKGIGTGADQLGPFAGIALAFENGNSLIPLVQHFFSYSGTDISTTAIRLIAMRSVASKSWLKLDAKVPVEWENDNTVPATAELQFGVNTSKFLAWYLDGFAGIGSDRPYDWGVGVGLRFKY